MVVLYLAVLGMYTYIPSAKMEEENKTTMFLIAVILTLFALIGLIKGAL